MIFRTKNLKMEALVSIKCLKTEMWKKMITKNEFISKFNWDRGKNYCNLFTSFDRQKLQWSRKILLIIIAGLNIF